MIIKKIPNPKKSTTKPARAAGLANYIVAPEKESGQEKCIHHEADNFLTSTHGAQVAEMIALSEEAIRSKDPIDHWVLSWHENERPTVDQARESVSIFIKHCGLKGHQVIWGLHDDTQNMHVHIAINRVYPDTFKVAKINKGFDRKAGQQACALIEHIQGWQPEKGSRYQIVNGKPRLRDQHANKPLSPMTHAQDMELQTGTKSAQRIGIEEAAPIIQSAHSWRELHDNLAAAGLRYERKGSGAIIFVGDTAIKAGDVARAASLPALQKRLGTYQPAKEIHTNEYHHHTPQPHPATVGKHTGDNLRDLSKCRMAIIQEGQYKSAGVLHVDARSDRHRADGLRRGAGRGATEHERPGYYNSNRADEGLWTANTKRGTSVGERQQLHVKPLKANQPGWSEYQIIRIEQKALKVGAVTELQKKHQAGRDKLFEKHKAERTEIFKSSWVGKGILRNAMQSVLATKQAAEKLELQEQHRAERAELHASYKPLPQFKDWKEKPQIVALKVQPTIDQHIIRDQQPQRLSLMLLGLKQSMDIRGYFTYKFAGVSIFRDEGKTLTVLDQSSQSLAAVLAVAQQKFGQNLTLTGSDAFKRNAVAAAAEHNLSCKFADPNLEALRLKLIEDKRLAEREARQQAQHDREAALQAELAKAEIETERENEANAKAAPELPDLSEVVEPQQDKFELLTEVPFVVPALPTPMLSTADWIVAHGHVAVPAYKSGDGKVEFSVLHVADTVVVKHGRFVAAYPISTGLILRTGQYIVIGKDGSIAHTPDRRVAAQGVEK